jgi:beta-mannosidase
LEHRNSISLEGNDWRLGYKKIYDGSASGTIAEVDKMTEWFDAVVPGNVRADLIAANRLPDLHIGSNNERANWVNDCVWWYTKKFAHPEGGFKRFFLELRGIDYLSQVYFNGRKLGENEGMFTRHLYDVTSMIRDDNVLNVRIMGSSFLPKPSQTRLRRLLNEIGSRLQNGQEILPERATTLKCQMSFGWDFAPDMRTMGIWDEVKLIGSGNVFIGHLHVRPSVFRELDSAKLQIRLLLNSVMAGPIRIMIQLRPANFDGPTQNFNFNAFAKKGTETIERNIVLEKPTLWNPWDRGNPNLYELTVKIYDGEKQSDHISGLIGLRSIEMARNPGTPKGHLDWTFLINGEREFIRGANWVPVDSLMGRVREEDYAELIKMAKEANINMLRVWGGGLREKRYFYEICSREGILVWQEFPFSCIFLGHLPTSEPFLRLAEKEVASIVRSVANYPCIALYCGGNEFSPSRNAKLLTRIARVVRSVDDSRPFLPASPARGDSHNWFVWHGFGNIREYQNDTCQFASEFGLQAVPAPDSLKRFLSNRGLWPMGPEWEYHKAEPKKLERYVGPASEFTQLEHFVEATQKMQAFALQTAIEHFRRRKYECSGAMFWQFNEPWPAISWSIIDYYRNPKLAYHKLKEIYSPVVASLKYEFKQHVAGETVPIEVWIVNDLLHPIEDCRLDIHMGGGQERSMNLSFHMGTIPADSSQPYVQFGLKLPDRPEWLLSTTLRSGTKTLSTNSYDFNMWDSGEASLWNRIYDRMSKWVLL